MSRKNKKVIRGEGETRQRILDAAVRHFAGAAYDEVGLRDIAGEVGVDVAYVHRCFGSKEKLFREVLVAASNGVRCLPDGEPSEIAAFFASQLVNRPHAKGTQGLEPLMILMRSASSSTGGRIVGERLQNDFIEPLSDMLGDDTQVRATMIMSLLIGFSIMRNVLHIPALADIEGRDAEALVERAIDGLISAQEPENLRKV